MYWRVRKLGPEQIARQYGVHAALIVSVIFNLVLFTKVNGAKAVTSVQKSDSEKFARQVTSHLYDASYLTFADSMGALTNELAPGALKKLTADGTVPGSMDELKTVQRELQDQKSVSCVKVDDVNVSAPDANGMLPIDMKVQIVVHNTEGVKPVGMKMRYLVGMARSKDSPEPRPIVVDLAAEPLKQ